MPIWNRDVRRSSLGFDMRSVAARNAAIANVSSVANLDIRAESESPTPEPDVVALVDEVRKASNPLPIVELAKMLPWDADRLSTALARGGELGYLAFSKSGDRTFVALPATAPDPVR